MFHWNVFLGMWTNEHFDDRKTNEVIRSKIMLNEIVSMKLFFLGMWTNEHIDERDKKVFEEIGYKI